VHRAILTRRSATTFAMPIAMTVATILPACGTTAPASSAGSGQASSGGGSGTGSSGNPGAAESSGLGSSGASSGDEDRSDVQAPTSGESSGSTASGLDAGETSEASPAAAVGDGGNGAPRSDGSTGTDAGATADSFACTLFVGNSTTQQFFDGGFLDYPGIDASKWELLWKADHYIDLWANPMDDAWNTPLDQGHACAASGTSGTMPDRVIFVVTRWPPEPESYYTTNLTSIVKIIQGKYPTVKRIDVMTLIRAPGNKGCDGTESEQTIPLAEDQGVSATAGAFPGLVFSVPAQYVPQCADFVSATAPQYSPTPGAGDVAKVYGQYFVTNP
jgi:hypothetical protein